jgi:hypothetical protein
MTVNNKKISGIALYPDMIDWVNWIKTYARVHNASEVIEFLVLELISKNPQKFAFDLYGKTALQGNPIRLRGKDITNPLTWSGDDADCKDCRNCVKSAKCRDTVILYDPTNRVDPLKVIRIPQRVVRRDADDTIQYPTVYSCVAQTRGPVPAKDHPITEGSPLYKSVATDQLVRGDK